MTEPPQIGSSFGDPGPTAMAGGGAPVNQDANVNLTGDSSGYRNQMGLAAQATQQTGQAVGGLLTQVDDLFKSAGRKLEFGGAGIGAGLGAGVASLGKLESQMASLQATSVVTGKSYNDFTKAVDHSFDQFSNNRGEIVALVDQLDSLGVKSKDIDGITQSMIRLSAATGDSIPGLTKGVVELGRSFNQMDSRSIERNSNALLTLSKSSGARPTDILQFSQAIAPLSRQAGLSQRDVLGVGTAFAKSGADSFVGVNTFNSMVNEISEEMRTGSPELAKYSNLIGKTNEQLRRLGAGQTAISAIEAIGRGDMAARNFVAGQGYGTRAISAAQAVAQGGGIREQVRLSNTANPNNLQRGSDAALGGLYDSLGKARNQVTRFGDTMAGPLLTPVTGLVKGFGSLLGGVNAVVGALGPIPGILGTVAGAVAPIAGFMLGHAGLVAGGALVRTMFGRESAGRQAFMAGRTGGAQTGTRLRDRIPYAMGRMMGPPGQGTPGRPGPLARIGGYAARTTQAATGFVYGAQNRMLRESMMSQQQRRESAAARPSMRQQWSSYRTDAARMAEQGVARNVTQQGGLFVRAVGGLAANTAKAGLSMARAGAGLAARAGAGALGAIPVAGGALARGARGAAAIAGTVGRAAFSLPGMLALGVGVPLISSLISKSSESRARDIDPSESYNAIKKYDALLGETSKNLATFNQKLKEGADAQDGSISVAGKSLADISKVTYADTSASAGGYKVTDVNFGRLASGDNRGGGAVDYIKTLALQKGGMTPKLMQAIKQDLIASYGSEQAQKILNDYMATNPSKIPGSIDYATLGNKGRAAGHDIDEYKGIIGQGMTAIDIQANAGAPGARTNRARLNATMQLLGRSLRGANRNDQEEQFATSSQMLVDMFGGEAKDYDLSFAPRTGGGRGRPGEITQDTVQRQILQGLARSKQGRAYLKTIGATDAMLKENSAPGGVRLDDKELTQLLGDVNGIGFPGQKTSQVNAQLRSQGTLGGFAANNRAVQAALGEKSGDPAAVQRAVESLSTKAVRTGGDMTKASGALTELADKMGGAATATGRLLQSAAAWTRQLQDLDLPNMSRYQQTTTLRDRMVTSQRAAARPGASQETIDLAKADKFAYRQQVNSNIQYMNQVYQQVRGYRIQMSRAQEDYQTQVFRSQRSFELQMQYSEADYLKSRSRQLEDFYTQQSRAANAAAKSIYNPFERVQSQSVVNGGILVDNLQDQNERIMRQRRQVAQLRDAGLSQNAIDTLGLADPNNAQQTNAIAQSVLNDPQTIKRINQEIQTRRKSTVSLTQSVFNEDFRNTMADFRKGLGRAAADYKTQHDRAVDAQRVALDDMARDYNKMVERTGEDLTTAMTELYGNFAKTYARTLIEINKDIGKAIPDLAKILNDALGGLPGQDGSGGADSAGSGAGAGPAGSSKNNRNYTPGTVGYNEKGELGTYDAGGRFHDLPINRRRYYNSLPKGKVPYIGNPKSTPADRVYSWLYQAGWPRGAQATRIMHAIVLAESGGNPMAHNTNRGTGDNSYGLAQINMIDSLGPSRRQQYGLKSNNDLFNPVTNLRVAYIMSGHGSHFGDWSTYNRGNYLAYMAEGGITRGTVMGERGRELVAPLESARGQRFLLGMYDQVSAALMARMQHVNTGLHGQARGDDHRQWHEDHRVQILGPTTVQVADPDEYAREMQARTRRDRLALPTSA